MNFERHQPADPTIINAEADPLEHPKAAERLSDLLHLDQHGACVPRCPFSRSTTVPSPL
jgi:hypothetical protein